MRALTKERVEKVARKEEEKRTGESPDRAKASVSTKRTCGTTAVTSRRDPMGLAKRPG
jgi:hypothetical protein